MEELIEFVETIKNNVHDWWVSYNRKLWTTHIFVYGGLLLLVIFVGAILFAKFNLFHTDANSARYMLSALVQSQAAIVAIVITLTLIAVQLTASAYSPRVIDIFKKNPDMWILLGCYGFSIFYGFIVLKLVEGAEGEFVSQSAIWSLGWVSISFESYVSLAYWLGAFTFVALFLYMINIINLLRPENIIKRLAIEITKENVSKFIESVEENEKDRKKPVEKDPILPIMDIIHGAVMKYDLETVRVGLKAVTDQMIEIIDSDSREKIIKCFCNHFRRVRMLTVDKMDEEATGEVIKSLETFGRSTAKKNLGYATQKITRSIELTGVLAAKKGECFDASTWQAVESLKLVEKVVMEKGEKFKTTAEAIALSLHNVAIAAAENKREWPTIWAVLSLEEIGKGAIKHELVRVTRRIVFSLLRIVAITTEKGLENATMETANSLAGLTILSEEIVKTAIQDYESGLEEKNRDSFQKFEKLYEQKLEKLRAER
ncbi:hypothetical protein C5S31_07820 [ANME-1 cluster archaeon GoMg2]|nr:hypothetical protein [ANME-1 cluster archaeon GoMg2]